MTFDAALLAQLEARVSALDLRAGTVVVGIDGRGGSGKSTLARDLAGLLPNAAIVQFDDFYRPGGDRQGVGADFDWRRLEAQVLAPLAAGEPARYQRYDWIPEEDRYIEACAPAEHADVVVDGGGSAL